MYIDDITSLYWRAVALEEEWQDKNPKRGPFEILSLEMREADLLRLINSYPLHHRTKFTNQILPNGLEMIPSTQIMQIMWTLALEDSLI